MFCPFCKKLLEKTIFHNTEIDYCPACLGLWFEQDELRQAKDEKDKDLNWLDIDLWKNKKDFKISFGQKLCPSCRLPLYEVSYGNLDIYSVKSPSFREGDAAKSQFNRENPVKITKGGAEQFNRVKVDVCNICQGIWLDRGEFSKIIKYLKNRADFEILNNYAKNLFQEFKEIFIGPETLREEILDFVTILKLLKYKFTIQQPLISKIISESPLK